MIKPKGSKTTGGIGLWWLIPFDALLGLLFLLLSLGDLRNIWPHSPGPGGSSDLITAVACLIDTVMAAALLVAAFLLLKQRRAAPFQRAAAWALLLRSGLVAAESFLPNEGGVDGVLRLGALSLLALLAVAALAGAAFLGRQEGQASLVP